MRSRLKDRHRLAFREIRDIVAAVRNSIPCQTGLAGVQLELEAMAAALEASDDYRVLRRLRARPKLEVPVGTKVRTGLFVDTETTGLDPSRDEIIELAMTPFVYGLDGVIYEVRESFHRFREPSKSIPQEITAITGISDAMVAGHTIDSEEVASFVGSASIIVAHNAVFDRRFLERFSDAFSTKPWACSMTQIDWVTEGHEGTKLAYLAVGAGFFYEKHRAVNDCAAAIELLALPLPSSGMPALSHLLERARRPTWRVWAEGAPFDLKEVLKARGYRWNDGTNAGPRSWYIDLSDDDKAAELLFLEREIYRSEANLTARKIDAYDRFSDRC